MPASLAHLIALAVALLAIHSRTARCAPAASAASPGMLNEDGGEMMTELLSLCRVESRSEGLGEFPGVHRAFRPGR
ncbi:unnamed protein product [Lampetra fluviatilis]